MAERISVGSVVADVVPDMSRFTDEIKARAKGITATIDTQANTAELREQISEATRTQPVTIRAKLQDTEAKAQLAALQNSIKDKQLGLNVSTAGAKAQIAKLQADIAATKATMKADTDTSEAEAKITAFQQQIKTLRTQLEVDTAPARAEISALQLEAAQKKAQIKAEADTAEAEAELDQTARKRTATIKANVDKSSLSDAQSGISLLTTSIVGLGPALIPVTAAVVGLGAALAAPIAAAGGGLTIFAFLAGFAIKNTEAQFKQIGQLQKQVESARLAVQNASTAAGKQSALQQEALAVTAYHNALDALSPAQKRFLDAQAALKGAFQSLENTAGPQIFGAMTAGMNALGAALPKLTPLLDGVSKGIGTLLGDVTGFVNSPGFRGFIQGFGETAQTAIISFGRIFENVMVGLFGLFKAFAPLSGGLIAGITNVSKSFADFGKNASQNQGLQKFIDYVRQVGPKVGATLGALALAIGNIVVAAAPLGTVALGAIKGIASAINKIPLDLLRSLAEAITAAVLASKGLDLATKLIGALTDPMNLVIIAIGALALGLIYAYNHSKPFRDIVQSLVGWFRDQLLPALERAWKTVLPGLISAFDTIKKSIHDNQGLFDELGQALKAVGEFIINDLIPAFALMWSKELPLLGKAFAVGVTFIHIYADGFLLLAKVVVLSFKTVLGVILGSFDQILKGAAIAFGWIPGIGSKIRGASAAFTDWKNSVNQNFDGVIAKINQLQKKLDSIHVKPIVLSVSTRTNASNKVAHQLGIPVGATGGIVNQPTLAVIGEAGPEAVVPLNQTPGNHPLPSGSGLGGGSQRVTLDLGNGRKLSGWVQDDVDKTAHTRAMFAGSGGVVFGA